jgi:hypothetical protein
MADNKQGDGNSNNEEERLSSGQVILIGSLIISGDVLVLTLIGGGFLRPTWPVIIGLILTGGLGTFFTAQPRPVVEWLEKKKAPSTSPAPETEEAEPGAAQRKRRSGEFRRRVRGALAISAVLLAALAGGAGVGWMVNKPLAPSKTPSNALPCSQPLELKVLTAPETRDVIQDAADRFAAHEAASRRCRPVHLTVFGEPSFSDVKYAFANGWEDDPSRQTQRGNIQRFIGPQPDIWMPGASAVADYIEGQPHPGVDLARLGSVATSPVVFAVPDRYRVRFQSHLPSAPTLRDLVEAAPKAGLGVGRPDPSLSEPGLLATADLYRTAAGDRDRKALEGKVTSVGAPLSSALDLLCALRKTSKPQVAAIVPEQAVLDYNQSKPLGVGCPVPITRPGELYSVFHPADEHSLDYPFVRVTWGGQADDVRDVMIGRFKAWLDDDRLHEAGFRDLAGRSRNTSLNGGDAGRDVRRFDEEDVGTALAAYPRARPPVTLSIAIDLSGSMNSPGLQQTSRLDRARELAGQTLDLVGPTDAIGLARFPGGREPDDVTSAELAEVEPGQAAHVDRTEKALAGLGAADGGSTPLYNAISDAADRLKGRGANPAVIVFTDGDNHVGSGLSADGLRDRLGDSRPRIILLAVGPKACDERDVTALTEDPQVAVCQDATTEEPDRLISQMFAELRMGT